jgi:ribosomal protein L11 methyltransferase
MNKYYYELTIKTESRFELFCEIVLELSQSAIEEDEQNQTIILRSEDKSSLSLIKEGIEAFGDELNVNIEIKIEEKENIDWIEKYKQSIKSVIGGKFYIRPSWEAKSDKELNLIDIIIDPALAFGSGHHETTNSCLEAVSKYVKNTTSVIDVGCGSGILSIASAKLGACVDICDTDDLAITDASKNFKLNSVELQNSWVGSANQAIKENKTYDVVIANILADIIVMISSDLKKVIADDGLIVLSGILEKYEEKINKKFSDMTLIETFKKNEWVTLVYKNNIKG